MSLETQEVSFPKDFEPPPLFNCDRISKGTLHVVAHPLDVLRQLDTGIADLANTVAVFAPVTPELLDSLAALAREREVDAFEFHM